MEETLAADLRKLNAPVTLGRTAALRHLVLAAPAPVVADALGYHYTTVHRHLAEAVGTWNRYASGDHN